MENIYDLLKFKTEISNFDELSQYLSENKFNFIDRYRFLLDRDHIIAFEKIPEESPTYNVELNFSRLFTAFYERFLIEEDIDDGDDERIFDQWVSTECGKNYVNERLQLISQIEEIVENTIQKYQLTPYNSHRFENHSGANYYVYNFLLPKEKFLLFSDNFRHSQELNWNMFFKNNKNGFSDREILDNWGDVLYLNSFIEDIKEWDVFLLKKYCSYIFDARKTFTLPINWTPEIIDFVIENYTDHEGVFSYSDDSLRYDEPRHTTIEFGEQQLKCVEWNIENIKKYFNFISYYNGHGDFEFNDNFYLFKTEWKKDEVYRFEKHIDWSIFSRTCKNLNEFEFFQEFEIKTIPQSLICNVYFKVTNDFIIKNVKKIDFYELIKSKFKFDVEIYDFFISYFKNNKYVDDVFKTVILKNANLSVELILYLQDKLDQKNKFKSSHRRGSRDEGEWFEYGYEKAFWLELSKNDKIIWNDLLLNKFFEKIIFEDLIQIEVSFKTINKFFNYQNDHPIYHFDSYKEPYSYCKTQKTIFNSILMKCNIIDLNKNNFLHNEFKVFGLWFNSKEYNKNIFNRLVGN